MVYTFQEFCTDCVKAMKMDDGEAGRQDIQKHFNKILARPEFVDELLGENPEPGRHIIHHDKETNLYILAHVYKDAGNAAPHDHGPFWVIYGNATGYTDMKEFRRLDDGSKEGYAELEVTSDYRIDGGNLCHLRRRGHSFDRLSGENDVYPLGERRRREGEEPAI